jgi:hypothetical protein
VNDCLRAGTYQADIFEERTKTMTERPNANDNAILNPSEVADPGTYQVGYVDLLENDPCGVHWLEGIFTFEDAKAQVEAANATERAAGSLLEWRFRRR